MKVTVELDQSDIRKAILAKLTAQGYPDELLSWFGANDFEIKTTYRSNESWRKPMYVRFRIEKTNL